MGTSTDGEIFYGIVFEEGFEFPWHRDDGDLETWWRDTVCSYKPPFEIWTAEGDAIPGITEEQKDEYYDAMNKFEAEHPVPVAEVNACSADYPMYALALPRTVLTANRGSPEEFDPEKLVVSEEEAASLLAFCKTHKIKVLKKQKPRWWLSSYWG